MLDLVEDIETLSGKTKEYWKGHRLQNILYAQEMPLPQDNTPEGLSRAMDEEIQSMREKGIIRKSTSLWASPIVLVKKKKHEVRFCIVYAI